MTLNLDDVTLYKKTVQKARRLPSLIISNWKLVKLTCFRVKGYVIKYYELRKCTFKMWMFNFKNIVEIIALYYLLSSGSRKI